MLAAGEHFPRQESCGRLLQHPLAGRAAQSQGLRQPERVGDERRLEERRARLDAVRHGAAVDLGEQVAAEVGLEVEQLKGDERRRLARAHEFHVDELAFEVMRMLERSVGRHPRAQLRREQRERF